MDEGIRGHAWSIESLPEDAGQLERVGEAQEGNRIYIYYRDAMGRYWYRNMIMTDQGPVSEYEAIFGLGRRARRRT